MKYSIEHVPKETEPEVIIRCYTFDDSLQKIVDFLDSSEPGLFGENDSMLHLLKREEILYIESLDRKIYIHTREKTYISRKKLYELEKDLENYLFFRASKWMILNIKIIKAVRPLFDGRFEAKLENDEKVYISRKYVPELKEKLL